MGINRILLRSIQIKKTSNPISAFHGAGKDNSLSFQYLRTTVLADLTATTKAPAIVIRFATGSPFPSLTYVRSRIQNLRSRLCLSGRLSWFWRSLACRRSGLEARALRSGGGLEAAAPRKALQTHGRENRVHFDLFGRRGPAGIGGAEDQDTLPDPVDGRRACARSPSGRSHHSSRPG